MTMRSRTQPRGRPVHRRTQGERYSPPASLVSIMDNVSRAGLGP